MLKKYQFFLYLRTYSKIVSPSLHYKFLLKEDCFSINGAYYVGIHYSFVQVLRELNGRPASYVYENDWAYFEPFHIPACEIIKEMDKFLLIIVKSSPLHFLVSFYKVFPKIIS